MTNIQILLFMAFTTVVVKRMTALECFKCNTSWSEGMCRRSSWIETCQHRHSLCMTVNTSVTDLKGEKSILFLRQCARKHECKSSQPCKDIKVRLWRENPGLFVDRRCRPQCCPSDHCNHPTESTPTPNLVPTTSPCIFLPPPKPRTSPKKCFEIEPEFIPKLPRRKPREKNCLNYGEFDSCFSLQAQVLNDTTRKVVETAEWKDCATESRDCHAIANRCAMVRDLAKRQGAHVQSCIVSCCDKDLCNSFTATATSTGDQLEITANRARRACEISVLIPFLVGIIVLKM